jgi:hypothetical protein
MQPEQIIDRYRHLRAISMSHHHAALRHVSRPAILEQARRLGLGDRHELFTDAIEELALVFDLVLYTAKPGRTRGLDRFAKCARFQAGSDEERMLDAMRRAQFSIWTVEDRHGDFGLILTDLMRETEVWLVDEGLTLSAGIGDSFAARLLRPDEFAMTSGVMVPVDDAMVEDALDEAVLKVRRADLSALAEEPQFAASIYRMALEEGVMDEVRFVSEAERDSAAEVLLEPEPLQLGTD